MPTGKKSWNSQIKNDKNFHEKYTLNENPKGGRTYVEIKDKPKTTKVK